MTLEFLIEYSLAHFSASLGLEITFLSSVFVRGEGKKKKKPRPCKSLVLKKETNSDYLAKYKQQS